MTSTVIIMAKEPKAGRVKTRLAQDVGFGRATMLFRKMLSATIGEAIKGDWQVTLAVDPPGAIRRFSSVMRLKSVGKGVRLVAQSPGGLGDRLASAINDAPSGPVIVIGGDAPDLRAVHLRKAFEILKRKDVVFGPACDGGFWLMGLARRRFPPDLFQGVRWSSADTLHDTCASFPAAYSIGYLDVLRDVDTGRDLSAVGARAFFKSIAAPRKGLQRAVGGEDVHWRESTSVNPIQ